MANINDALKRLFLKLGGDPDDLKDDVSVEDYIDNLGEVLCGAELPPVSGSDNGKVLTVSSGKWAAEQPASPTSYELTGSYYISEHPELSINMPSGLTRISMCTSGKAIKDNTFLNIQITSTSGFGPTRAYLPCTTCTDDGCIFEGIAVHRALSTVTYKKVTVYVSFRTETVSDAIKVEDFSFETT